jgi:hypothetical protein
VSKPLLNTAVIQIPCGKTPLENSTAKIFHVAKTLLINSSVTIFHVAKPLFIPRTFGDTLVNIRTETSSRIYQLVNRFSLLFYEGREGGEKLAPILFTQEHYHY